MRKRTVHVTQKMTKGKMREYWPYTPNQTIGEC